MKALAYQGPGEKAWQDKPAPTLEKPGDAIVRITRIANIGVHGKSVELRLEKLGIRNITLTTGLVKHQHHPDAAPHRRRRHAETRATDHPPVSARRHPGGLSVFADAAREQALKVILSAG